MIIQYISQIIVSALYVHIFLKSVPKFIQSMNFFFGWQYPIFLDVEKENSNSIFWLENHVLIIIIIKHKLNVYDNDTSIC